MRCRRQESGRITESGNRWTFRTLWRFSVDATVDTADTVDDGHAVDAVVLVNLTEEFKVKDSARRGAEATDDKKGKIGKTSATERPAREKLCQRVKRRPKRARTSSPVAIFFAGENANALNCEEVDGESRHIKELVATCSRESSHVHQLDAQRNKQADSERQKPP